MSNSLESINLDFKKSFHSIFQKPELIKSFLTKRSNKFDEVIKKEFIRRELETDFALVAHPILTALRTGSATVARLGADRERPCLRAPTAVSAACAPCTPAARTVDRTRRCVARL